MRFLSFRTQVLGCRFLVLDRCFYLVFGCGFCCWDFFLARGSCFGFGLWLMCLCIQQLHFTEYHVISCGFMDSHGISWMLI